MIRYFLTIAILLIFSGNVIGATRLLYEDCEYTGYSEHFLERYVGSSYNSYWEEFKSEVSRSTYAPHGGNACMTYNPFATSNPHATIGIGATSCGSNTSGWNSSSVHSRTWYFRWYHRWETGIQWNGTNNKTIHVNQNSNSQGTSLTVVREGSKTFHITLRNNGNLTVNTWRNVAQSLDNMQWHKMELYIDYGTNNSDAELIFKCDDVTVYSGSNLSMSGIDSNPVKFINAWPGNLSGLSPTGTAWQWLDDLEIWDGLPDGDDPSPVDNHPTVNIIAPTSQSSYVSNTDVVSLGGNANDDDEIASLTWSLNGVDQGTVLGNWPSWVVQDIPLEDGNNTIVVRAIDSASQPANDTITVAYNPEQPPDPPDDDTVMNWSAMEQTGDSGWSDSGVTWCARLLIEGSSITRTGNRIQLGFQGRSSGNYRVKKVSIAERDINGEEGDVVDSTWSKVTFDGNSQDEWDSDVTTILANTEKLSDTIMLPYSILPEKDYYVTFTLENPSVYLIGPSYYREMYFDDADHSEDKDWSSNGYSTWEARVHALSSVHVGVAPADVSNFQANPDDCQVALSWINPGDDDFVGVNIRYRTDHYPEHYQDGASVYNGSGISYNHPDLQNNITYYYSAFTYDDKNNYSSTAHASATPEVNPGTNQAPIVNITGSFTGEANSEVNFTSSVEDPDGQIIACHWDFGDGDGNDNCSATTHTYSKPGSYTVTATSTDDDGATGADSIKVLISPDVTSPKIVSAVAVQ